MSVIHHSTMSVDVLVLPAMLMVRLVLCLFTVSSDLCIYCSWQVCIGEGAEPLQHVHVCMLKLLLLL